MSKHTPFLLHLRGKLLSSHSKLKLSEGQCTNLGVKTANPSAESVPGQSRTQSGISIFQKVAFREMLASQGSKGKKSPQKKAVGVTPTPLKKVVFCLRLGSLGPSGGKPADSAVQHGTTAQSNHGTFLSWL